MSNGAPVGLVAAAGELPLRLAEGIKSSGRPVFVVALEDIADADYAGFEHEVVRLGALSRIFSVLVDKGCRELVLAGKLHRPKMAGLVPDKLASRVALRLLAGGDDAALGLIAEIASEHGLTMVDKAAFLGGHHAGEGLLAGPEVPGDAFSGIETGKAVLEATGPHDIGQAVLVQGERVLAVEAAEGTDAMLERSAGLVDPDLPPAVLVKMPKSSQHRHLDPPVVGAATLAKAAKAGVGVVAVEAGGVLFADPDAIRAEAERLGVSLVGVSR